MSSFNPSKFYLGRLCIDNHDWEGTGQSRRRITTRACVECALARTREWRTRNLERVREYGREYGKTHLSERREYDRHRYSTAEGRQKILAKNTRGRQRHAERWKETNRRNYLLNKESVLAKRKEYWQILKNTEAYKQRSRIREARRRARKRSAHSCKYSAAELNERLTQFKNQCTYCQKALGQNVALHWDHFLPIGKGNPDCLGNLLPACSRCNLSKHDKDVYEWFSSQSFFSKKRWREILKLLGKEKAGYDQLPLL